MVNISAVVETAVTNAGQSDTLGPPDINKILTTLENDVGKDRVTLAEVRAIDSTLNRLARSGKISWERAESFRGQIRDSVDRAVENQQMHATEMAKKWLSFNQAVDDGGIRQMARQSATDRDGFFSWFRRGHKMTKDEVGAMLQKAAEDGKITLSEVNAMYAGVDDAFKAGEISRSERNEMITELETNLKQQAGRRRGACANRVQGPYADKLTPEAEKFIQEGLGGTMGRSKGKGWTTWTFDQKKVQDYTKAICQDGKVSPAERQSLMNMLLRDGRVTFNELRSVRQAFAWARWEGHITTEEYDRTIRVFEADIAKMTGGVKADTLQQELSLNRHGMVMIPG